MITLKEVIVKSEEFLNKHHIQSARRQVEDLLSQVLKKSRIDLFMNFDQPLTDLELTTIRQALLRMAKKEPLAYIQGQVQFYHCEIFVSPDVLIPRQETEILVDRVVKTLKSFDLKNKVLWDIGTGSGAIAIAIKKACPELTVIASDLSDKALQVAKKNAEHNKVQIEWLNGDLFTPFASLKADFIISNPPYISEHDYKNLESEVLHHEPKMSLVALDQGYEFYLRIAKELKKYLNDSAKAWFEIGYNQGNEVEKIFKSQGFDKVHFEKDYSGNDRFFFLELE